MHRSSNGEVSSSHEKYKIIFDNIQDIYYEVSLDGTILEVSPSVERLTKYKVADLIGKSVYELYANPEKRQDFLKMINKAQRVDDFEFVVKDKEGQIKIGSVCAKLVIDGKGNAQKIVGSIRDVTERKKLLESLEQSEQWYRTLFETTGAATAIVEEDGTISMINNNLVRLSGCSKKQIEGKKKWMEFVAKDDLAKMEEYHRLRRIDPNAAPSSYEFRLVDKNGTVKNIFSIFRN